MPYLQWTDSLLMGIKTIDDQHRRLVDMVNELHDLATGSGQRCPTPEMVARLKTYAGEHFLVEEGYMQAFAYSGYAAHKKEHEAFCAALQCFEKGCADGRVHPAELLEFLKSWLTNHILDVDMKMGQFLGDYL
jgi:hemerythrin